MTSPDAEALLVALRQDDSRRVEELLSRDPSLARSRDGNGVSFVCLAVYFGRDALARRLARERSDLDLFEASTLGDAALVRSLLARDPALGACPMRGAKD